MKCPACGELPDTCPCKDNKASDLVAHGASIGRMGERDRVLAIIAEMRGPFQFASTWWTLDKLVARINEK